jgi:hypothetical protein
MHFHFDRLWYGETECRRERNRLREVFQPPASLHASQKTAVDGPLEESLIVSSINV